LNYNKIKIFLTIDDLMDRGLTKEDLWKDSLKVHQLFREMMDEASEELGFEASGPIAVEVYSLQAQGMVIIVTKNHEEEEIVIKCPFLARDKRRSRILPSKQILLHAR
jgi:adapter protein MecA 1/2